MGDNKVTKTWGTASENSVPKAVITRLSLYLRELRNLVRDRTETTSSAQLGELLGFTDAQVRKDLAFFGQFGHSGIGYRCSELIDEIKKIMGTDRPWPVAIVGVGNLGRALLRYKGFPKTGFEIVAAFDVDPAKIGREIDGIRVFDLDRISQVVDSRGIKLAIIAVPPTAAQAVATRLVAAGIDGVLNFAPATISLPASIGTVGVDLTNELERLSFAVLRREANP